MATDIFAIAQSQVERLEGELAQATQRTREAKEREDHLASVLEAWKVILRENGDSQPVRAASAPTAVFSVAVSADEAEAVHARYGHKTSVVRDLFKANPERGFSPGEVSQFLQSQGISGKNFVYGTLSKMRERQELVYRNGRYYASPKLTSLIKEELIQRTLQ